MTKRTPVGEYVVESSNDPDLADVHAMRVGERGRHRGRGPGRNGETDDLQRHVGAGVNGLRRRHAVPVAAWVASVIALSTSASPAAAEAFTAPLAGPNLSQGYNVYHSGAGGYHTGYDYTASDDTVRAAASGTVVDMQVNGEGCSVCTGGPQGCGDHGLGNTAIMEHVVAGETVYTLYGHMASFAPGLSVGMCFVQGAALGVMGGTGQNCTNYWSKHLHFEVKHANTLKNPWGGGSHWGYTPGNPDGYGYEDPGAFFGDSVQSGCTPPDWWCLCISDLQDLDLLSGTCSEYYSGPPFDRATFVTIVGDALDIEDTAAWTGCSNPFSDVDDGVWYENYVSAMAHLEYDDGVAVLSTSSGLFEPGDNLTRCDAVKVISEAWDLPPSSMSLPFSDAGQIPGWCKGYVQRALANGVVSATSDAFNPTATLTVGGAACMVSDAIEKLGTPTPSPGDFVGCDGSGCSDGCSYSGQKTCAGSSGYKTCGDYDGDPCLEWSSTSSCGSGKQCQGDGACVTVGTGGTCMVCDDDPDCLAGYGCYGPETYPQADSVCLPEGCSNDGDCPAGTACFEFSSGATVCWAQSQTWCQGDEVWSGNACGVLYAQKESCGGTSVCSDGQCVTTCSDQCDWSGEKTCWGNTSYKTCGQHDGDGCLEWGSTSSCGAGQECQGDGDCVTIGTGGTCAVCDADSDCLQGYGCYGPVTYEDADSVCLPEDCSSDGDCPSGMTCYEFDSGATTCWVKGQSWCQGDEVWSGNTCGVLYEKDQTCGTGTTCSDGACVATCSDQCGWSGQQQCAGLVDYETCGDHDGDGCLEWGATAPCATGELCEAEGSCVAVGIGGTCEVCDSDADCLPGYGCYGHGDYPGAGAVCLPEGCSDDWDCPAGTFCHEFPTGDTLCWTQDQGWCQGDDVWTGNTCGGLYEQVGTCGSGTSCFAGGCVADCGDQCSYSGQRACAGGTTYQVCGDTDGDGCLEWSPPKACGGGSQCQGPGECTCTPSCTGKSCGDDGCGGSCGTCGGCYVCSAAGQCAAEPPECGAQECGHDACGNLCGSCGACSECSAQGACVATASECNGKQCGVDACGNSCGECDGCSTCSAEGGCVAKPPACDGAECGFDTCGRFCGSCAFDEACVAGQCVAVCTRDCGGKECGSDGCGGFCGSCSGAGESCQDGACVAEPVRDDDGGDGGDGGFERPAPEVDSDPAGEVSTAASSGCAGAGGSGGPGWLLGALLLLALVLRTGRACRALVPSGPRAGPRAAGRERQA